MINPEQRKEIIILLKILQDEAKWNKIYAYVNSVLKEKDGWEYHTVVSEPVVRYGTNTHEIWLTEEEAQEILEAYEAHGDSCKYTKEELEDCIAIADYCKAHPEECYTWEEVQKSMRAVYAI
jgi:hypothetical protein